MTSWTERPMRSWLRIGLCLAVLPLLVSMAITQFVSVRRALGAFDDVAARYRDERGPLHELRVQIVESAMPVEEFIESRQETLPARYRAHRVGVESAFAQLAAVVSDEPALASLLARAQQDWTSADRIAAGLLAHPGPPGDPRDGALESQLDSLIVSAADKLRAMDAQLDRSVETEHAAAEHASEVSSWISGIAAVLSLLLVFAGVTVISRIMLRNVQRLVDGARRFAQGDREHRIEIGVPPELREVAEEFNRMIGKIDEAEEALAAQVRTDPLTGLDNRRSFDATVDASLARMRRFGEECVVVAVDVDHFKRVNDTYGHGAGDDVLREVGATLKRSIREVDRAFRIGGEEFVLLLADVDGDGARRTAERVRAAIEATTIVTGGHELRVTASFGLAKALPTSRSADLLHAADTALYAAKAAGRNRIEIAPAFPQVVATT